MNSRLTEAGCARMWRSAQQSPPQPHEARVKCLTCPLGPQRAGAPREEVQRLAHRQALSFLRRWCPRCQRQTTRLVNQLRCVSCFNRHREADRGRNAKGGRPKLCAVLHTETIAVTGDGGEATVVRVAKALCRAEAMLRIAQRAGPGVMFGLAGVAARLQAVDAGT